MAYTELIDLAWRLYQLGMISAEAMGWISLMIGTVGYLFSTNNVEKQIRYRGLIIGGSVALVAIAVSGYMYNLITFIMIGEVGGIDHTTAMYPDVFLDMFQGEFEELNTIVSMSGILSQMASILGVVSIAFGAGLWGMTAKDTEFNHKSKRFVVGGIGLLIGSVAERVLAGGTVVLIRSTALGAPF